jgi:hypothetical protein
MAKWLLFVGLLGGLALAAPADGKPKPKPPVKTTDGEVKVHIRGMLKSGIVAIGGETTGYLISADGVSWELDFRTNKEARAQADKLSGQPVEVTGTFISREGVEVRRRQIVTVDTFKPAEAKDDLFVKVTIRGTLKTGIVAIGGETTGTQVTAGGTTWELDLSKDKDLQALAQKLNGQTVVVSGTLTVRKTVAAPPRLRSIVTVTSLTPAGK